MPGTLAVTLAVCAGSLILGRALCPAGPERVPWPAPAVGLAALMAVCGIAIRLPGRAVTATVLAVLVVLAGAWLLVRRGERRISVTAGLTAAVALAGGLIPFLSNGRFGMLGVSFNNDMAVHLLLAEHLRDPGSVLNLSTSYPLGPHSLAATAATLLHTDMDLAFSGLLLATVMLTALTAFTALERLPRLAVPVVAALVALPYLVASYYGEAAFKETLQALWVLAFALQLRALEVAGRASPAGLAGLGLIGAGSVYTYSYPGLAWLVGTLAIWVALKVAAGGVPLAPRVLLRRARQLAGYGAVAGAVGLIAVVPEVPRILRLFHSVSLSASASSAIPTSNLGNLAMPLSPYEGLGIWMKDDFRFLPPNTFHAGLWSAVALGVALYGALWWVRRRDLALPAAVAASALIYWRTKSNESPYVAAKALVVLGPSLMLLGLRALLEPERVRRLLSEREIARLAVVGVFVVGAAWSSYLALRLAWVGPRDHTRELATLRPTLRGQPTLFLAYDDFVGWELRGVPVSHPVPTGQIPSAMPIGLQANKPWVYGQAFDWDSVEPAALDRFPYVLTIRGGNQSAAPPNFRLVRQTRTYRLWRRAGATPPRMTLPESGAAGAVLKCRTRAGRRISRLPGEASLLPLAVAAPAGALTPGASVAVPLRLPPGRWEISVQYTGRQGLTVDAPGMHASLPANLDRPGPFYDAGTVVQYRTGVRTFTLRAGSAPLDPPIAVSLPSAVLATQARPERVVPLAQACGRPVDFYRVTG